MSKQKFCLNDIKTILKFIGSNYDIEYKPLLKDVKKFINDNNLSKDINSDSDSDIKKDNKQDISYCRAYIAEDTRCTRKIVMEKTNDLKKRSKFCKTHLKQYKDNTLPFGYIRTKDITKDIKKDIKKENIYELNKKEFGKRWKNDIHVECLTIDGIDYLYDPIKRYVYDFYTYNKIGKLSEDALIRPLNKVSFKED
jgi:hypothetical protein